MVLYLSKITTIQWSQALLIVLINILKLVRYNHYTIRSSWLY